MMEKSWCKTCGEDTNETTWPKVTIEGDKVRISYPIDRPYTKEILEFMKSKNYVLMAARHADIMTEHELTFVSVVSMESRLQKLLKGDKK